ncbi:M23 family peptidase, partial [Streptomyces sp. NPDC059949]
LQQAEQQQQAAVAAEKLAVEKAAAEKAAADARAPRVARMRQLKVEPTRLSSVDASAAIRHG